VLLALREALQAVGYRGSGRRFARRNEHGTVFLIEVQRSTTNDAGRIKFTINAKVVVEVLLDATERPLRPGVTPSEQHLLARIGHLMDPPSDLWWLITESSDAAAVKQEVVGAVLGRALPYLDQFADPVSLAHLWRSGQSPGLTEKQRERFLSKMRDAGLD
jgi:hypothetical protein